MDSANKQLIDPLTNQTVLNQALINAVNKCYDYYVRFFIRNGADIHYDNDYTFRQYIKFGKYRMVKFLIKYGANIHVQNNYPLRCSATEGYGRIVKLLVKNGGTDEKALQLSVKNEDMRDWLDRHFLPWGKYNPFKAFKALLKTGLDPHQDDDLAFKMACASGHLNVIHLLIKKYQFPKSTIQSGIMESTNHHHLRIAKYLINSLKN